VSEPTPNETTTYYDTIANGYNELHGEEQRRKYTIIAQQLTLPPNAHVLDVGAGTGIGHSIIPSVGIDPSPALLRQHPNPASIVGRAESLPFPDKSFDAVLCVTAIHHADFVQGIAEMLRVSRGPVVVTVLKKSSRTPAIMHAFLHACKPVRVLDEEKDYILVYDPRMGASKPHGEPPNART
jgi:ubiquinone/menaquinone biosynthesis C-methylase UbiE